ncbi:hypothetical protein [Dysgonomonas termitidis]|uniref:Uncharacterized protein n=1 Tax=Dysgonomonas termitidis TaxID=1516126 RepID=A0ABV9L1J7_9BACT
MKRIDIVNEAVNMPAPRYYITEHEAGRMINKMMKGYIPQHKRMERRKMYFDMFNAFLEWRINNPDSKISEGINYVIYNEAPGFYITAQYASQIKIR